MPIPQAHVLDAISLERERQDAKHGPLTEHGHTAVEWLLIIERKLQQAKDDWYSGDGSDAQVRMLQIAATATACLEQHAKLHAVGIADPPELKVEQGRLDQATGIFVRATLEGRWGSYDIAELDRASLLTWLRSRGGANPWAENVVLAMLGHDQ